MNGYIIGSVAAARRSDLRREAAEARRASKVRRARRGAVSGGLFGH